MVVQLNTGGTRQLRPGPPPSDTDHERLTRPSVRSSRECLAEEERQKRHLARLSRSEWPAGEVQEDQGGVRAPACNRSLRHLRRRSTSIFSS